MFEIILLRGKMNFKDGKSDERKKKRNRGENKRGYWKEIILGKGKKGRDEEKGERNR